MPGLSDEECAALLDRNRERLRRLAIAMCHEEAEREDLAQEMVLAVWRGRSGFRGEAKASTWLHRIAVTVALQRLRRRRTRPQPVALDDGPEPEAPDADAARTARQDLLRAMARLPDVDRAVLALHLEDRPLAEIAEVVGSTPNAIAVRLLRIRERLRHLLSDYRHA